MVRILVAKGSKQQHQPVRSTLSSDHHKVSSDHHKVQTIEPEWITHGKKNHVNGKGDQTMDVASFREILRIQQLDNDEFSRKHDTGQRRQKTSEEWNGFWSKAVKVERKKRRKPLTVIESNERRKKKARAQIVKRFDDMRPMLHLFDNPDLHL